ncbi:MAG: hypothetical protein LWX83_15845 [Anaerolineae bacterium]|nr:hypothetical protein [Anaerolineae bacterium]
MDDWYQIIKQNLQLKPSEELQQILARHDPNEWTEYTFTTIKEILDERHFQVQTPSRLEKNKFFTQKIYPNNQRKLFLLLFLGFMLVAVLFIFGR